MSQYVTKYKKENGKIRKDKSTAKPADKNGASGSNTGADNQNKNKGA